MIDSPLIEAGDAPIPVTGRGILFMRADGVPCVRMADGTVKSMEGADGAAGVGVSVPSVITLAMGSAFGQSAYSAAWAGPTATKEVMGLVKLSGLVEVLSATSGENLVCTLPEGYRPQKALMFTAWHSGGIIRIDVRANGEVICQGLPSAYLSLESIAFHVPVTLPAGGGGGGQGGGSFKGTRSTAYILAQDPVAGVGDLYRVIDGNAGVQLVFSDGTQWINFGGSPLSEGEQ